MYIEKLNLVIFKLNYLYYAFLFYIDIIFDKKYLFLFNYIPNILICILFLFLCLLVIIMQICCIILSIIIIVMGDIANFIGDEIIPHLVES